MKAEGLIQKLLTHYPCPESCAACCEKLKVPFTPLDVRKIGKNSREYQQVFTSLKSPTGKYEAYNTFKILPNLPCVFLNGGKCKIYTKRPLACRVYPINVRKTIRASNEPEKDVLIFRVYMCPVGANICCDYLQFLYSLTRENITTETETGNIKDVISQLGNIKKMMYEAFTSSIINFRHMNYFIIDRIELLRAFVIWLDFHEDLAENRLAIKEFIIKEFEEENKNQ